LDARYSFQPVAVETLEWSDQRLCSRISVQPESQDFSFSQAMIDTAAFCYSESLSCSSDLMLFCNMRALQRMRT